MEGLEVDSEDISFSARNRTPSTITPTTHFALFQRIGGLNCVCVLSSGKPLFCLGPDWGYFLCMVTSILALDQVFIFLMYPGSPSWLQVWGTFTCLLLTCSYSLCALLDPGVAVDGLSLDHSIEDLENKMKDLRFCGKCGVLRATETYHCDDCDVCIEGYDHHCPFTGKCIGKGNILCFQTFLASILMTMVFAFVWIVAMTGVKERRKG